MNNTDILMIITTYLFFAAIFFRIIFIKKDIEDKLKFVMNKFKLTLFGKIVSAILCLPIFALFGIYILGYRAIIKK